MARNYTLTAAADLPETRGNVDTKEASISNVEAAFSRLRANGEYLGARDGGLFAGSRYTNRNTNGGGVLNHFQGMMRLGHGHVVVSGGDWRKSTRASHLFIAKMNTRRANGVWRSNVLHAERPDPTDQVVKVIAVDGALWHAGGMDVLGNVLALPIEFMSDDRLKVIAQGSPSGPDTSRIVFFDVADPANPRFFKSVSIDRTGVKAGAVGITKIGGRILVAAWSDSDSLPPRLDLYLSKDHTVNSGFGSVTSWDPEQVLAVDGQTQTFGKVQTINFVRQTEDDQLYLIGFRRFAGEDLAELYAFDARNLLAAVPTPPTVTKLDTKRLMCKKQCDMNGASGAYVDDGELVVYSGAQYRNKHGDLRFVEFRSPVPTTAPNVSSKEQAWVEVFEETHFKGRFFSLDAGSPDARISDYRKVFVQREKFDDTVASVRYQLPTGLKYVLYENRKFGKPLLELAGTGQVEELPDLISRGKGGQVSSSELV